MTDQQDSINKPKVNIEKVKVLKKNTVAKSTKVRVAPKTATVKVATANYTAASTRRKRYKRAYNASKTAFDTPMKVKNAARTVANSKPVRNIKKDSATMGKSYDEIKAALQAYASSGALKGAEGEDEPQKNGLSAAEALAYADLSIAATNAVARAEIIAARRTGETVYIVTKTGVKISVHAIKKLRRIQKQKQNIQLMQAGASVKLPVPGKKSPPLKKGVPVKAHKKTAVMVELPSNNKLKRSGKAMRRKMPTAKKKDILEQRREQLKAEAAANPPRQVRTKGKATIYNVSKLEEMYGIHGGNTEVTGVHAVGEEIKGVRERVTEKKPVDHTPKEIKDPSREERVATAEKNLGIKSKNAKDQAEKVADDKKQLDKKKNKKQDNKRKHQKRRSKAAKNAAKRFVAGQLLEDGSEDFGAAPLGLAADYLSGRAHELISNMFSKITSTASTLGKKLLKWVLHGLWVLLSGIVSTSVGCLFAIIGPAIFVVVLVAVVAVGGVMLIGGFFVSLNDSGQFAAEYIHNYSSAIIEEAKEYDEVNYYPSGSQYANYDDMMLCYLSRVADLEDDADMEGDAPFMWINKRAETKAIKNVTESMFYYETEERTEKRWVQVWVTCTPTPTPEPTPEPTGSADAEVTPVPSEAPSQAPTEEPTPIPTPTTNWTYYWEEEEVTIKTINIYRKSAAEYMAGISKKQILENYDILKDLFEEFGYVPFGGSTVCDNYGIDYKSSD